jgi:hypothetical protein
LLSFDRRTDVGCAGLDAVPPDTLATYFLILFDTDFQEKKDSKGTSRTAR